MKFKCFLLIYSTLCLLLSGCNNYMSNYDNMYNIRAIDYVKLADYKNIEIPLSYTEISHSDVESIISWDFSSSDTFIAVTDRKNILHGDVIHLSVSFENTSTPYENFEYYYEVGSEDIFEDGNIFTNHKTEDFFSTDIVIENETAEANIKILGIYRYVTLSDEDAILSYYGYDNMNDVVKFLKNRAYNEIVYHYMWDYIYENSQVTEYPDFVKEEINSIELERKSSNIQDESSELTHTSINNTDYEEQTQEIYDYYCRFLLAKAILENEKIEITDEDTEKIIEEICQKQNISSNEVLLYCGEYEIYYKAVMQKSKQRLIQLIKIVK